MAAKSVKDGAQNPDNEFSRMFGWPTCAKCKKPVDDVATSRDLIQCGYFVIVTCHGESESLFIDEMQLISCGIKDGHPDIRLDGEAFKTCLLP